MDNTQIKETLDSIEYIDLGLSVKWGTCNLGAKTPEETGHRFTYDEKAEVDYVNLPTKEQCEELINNCTWKWRDGKHKGCYVIGKNGNKIFLPAVGELHYKGKMNAEGEGGSYWSSSFQGRDKEYPYYMTYLYKYSFFDLKFIMSKDVTFTSKHLRTLVIRPVK